MVSEPSTPMRRLGDWGGSGAGAGFGGWARSARRPGSARPGWAGANRTGVGGTGAGAAGVGAAGAGTAGAGTGSQAPARPIQECSPSHLTSATVRPPTTIPPPNTTNPGSRPGSDSVARRPPPAARWLASTDNTMSCLVPAQVVVSGKRQISIADPISPHNP